MEVSLGQGAESRSEESGFAPRRPSDSLSETGYERRRKLFKWVVFSALLSAVALFGASGWPSAGSTYFTGVAIVMSGMGEMLVDRRHTTTSRHGGRADYTYILHILVCIGVAGYSVFKYGNIGDQQTPLNLSAFVMFIASVIVGASATYFSEAGITGQIVPEREGGGAA